MSSWTSRGLRPPEAAILHHPDRRTAWAPAIVVEVAGPPLAPDHVAARLAALAAEHSILGARLRGGRWTAGAAPGVGAFQGDLATFCRRFELADEAPLRVALSDDGRLAVTAHHAALDGRALLMVAGALLGVDSSSPTGSPAPARPELGGPSGSGSALARLVRPADRVAPSSEPPSAEVFVAAELPASAQARVAALSGAAVGAAQSWNAECGAPWRRVGLTIPVGGPPVIGNVSTHRRVDVPAGADVAAAVNAALRAPAQGAEHTPNALVMRALAPVVDRFSDSLLVSNLGLVDLPGAAAVDFHPQARGRSAVAIGAASVQGGERRLTLRARDLSEPDARALLEAIIARLSG